ncbi:MAG: V-type ATP synthase subunit I [Oscillospiraceae bacterium]
MAIVKMKKLQAMALRSQRTELLKELMRLGCVELQAQDVILDTPETAFLVKKESVDVASFRTQRQIYADALKVLDQYAPQKTALFSQKPALTEQEFLDESEEARLKGIAKELSFMDDKIKNLVADETREKLRIEALTPWKDCDLPLDCAGTRNVGVLFGTVPADVNMDKFCAAVEEALPETLIEEVSADENLRYLVTFYLRSGYEELMNALREYSFAVPAYGYASGYAADGIKASEDYIREIESEKVRSKERIAAAAEHTAALKVCYDRATGRIEMAEASELLLRTENMILLQGWAVEEEEAKLVALLERFGCAYELSEPTEEEYPQVPVKLRNNPLTNGLNMVTNMYSLPRYGTVDPNPLMAPFFILFYGIMMADMGYGLVMMIAGAFILMKLRPKDGFLKYFGQLMVEGGLATFVMGAVIGGFFGDAPYHLVHLLNPASTWEGLPALFNPLEDTIMVLVGAMILGFIHLNTGMAVSFVMKIRDGKVLDGVFYELSLWIVFIGAALAIFGVGSVGGVPVVLCVGGVMLFYGSTRGKKGLGKFTAIFGLIYNELTGWFGDILSYSRLMALMLAGSVIAQVFNTLGAMPGSILVFLIVALLGNALNFALNLLGCYVHDLRLQCLEFFNKFYVDGGKPFKPLAIRSKYFNVMK